MPRLSMRFLPQAQLALVGDSSCLINLDAAGLQLETHLETVNLGTLSYLSLDSFGLLASRFAAGKVTPRVLLVVHPECLRILEASQNHRAMLDAALDPHPSYYVPSNSSLSYWLGFEDFGTRFVDRWIPTPLQGAFGARYGFTTVLRQELLRRKGTMDETASY